MEMQFYMKECIKENWSVRELKRQINSSLFQRLALSTDKEGVLALANEGHQVMTAADIIRDPYVLEFTGLPQQKRYKESELENALKKHMEDFLLELGRGFAFIGRQYIIPIGSRRFKVDLVFYHAILKCYVLIDLKRAEIRHQDIGQMNLYLNYFKNEICQPDDNPPIGIVLGARKDELLMEYALEGIDNTLCRPLSTVSAQQGRVAIAIEPVARKDGRVPQADASALKTEIDMLVYDLYGLDAR